MDVYDATIHSVTEDGLSTCEEVITRKSPNDPETVLSI